MTIIEVGDIVRLASGGPDMTVIDVQQPEPGFFGGIGYVEVEWFDKEHKYRSKCWAGYESAVKVLMRVK